MITIIVPIHNVKEYIYQCLNSIRKQSYKNIEVLCIDSSNDGTTKLVQEFVDKDPRFVLIRDRNSSYGYKINLGISLANGNYIGIVDGDDYISTKMYEKAYQYIKQYKADFVKFDYTSFSTYPTIKNKYMHYTFDKDLYRKVINSKKYSNVFYDSNIAIWSGLYKKSFIIKNSIKLNETPKASFQDTGFFVLTHLYAKKFIYINESYYKYRRNSINASSSSGSNVYSIIKEFDYIFNTISLNKHITSEQFNAIIIRKIMSYSWNYIRLEEQLADKFKNKVQKEIKSLYKNDVYNKTPLRIKKYILGSCICNN